MKVFTGDEKFRDENGNGLGFGITDFWRWAYGNLLDNTKRGAVAEFIVMKALGLDSPATQADWGAFDIFYNKARIEVKSAAYVQAWHLENSGYSAINFSIRPAYAWNDDTSAYNNVRAHNNDVYVFAVFGRRDKSAADISMLGDWEFYVVPTRKIEELFGGQKTVSLDRLKIKAGARPVRWSALKEAVDCAIKEAFGL